MGWTFWILGMALVGCGDSDDPETPDPGDTDTTPLATGSTGDTGGQPPTGLSGVLFHGPIVFQGARTNNTWVPLSEFGGPTTIEFVIDEFSFGYPDGYVFDGCEITGTDITSQGLSVSTSIASGFGTGSASVGVTAVNDGTRLTWTAEASGSASASPANVGSGSTSGILYIGYPDSNRLHDLSLAISNPSGDPFEVRMSWGFSGTQSSSNTDDHGMWLQRFTYQVDPSPCSSNPEALTLFHGSDNGGPESDSGVHVLQLDGTEHLLSFGIEATASGVWAMDHLGRGGSGGGQSESTVTIELARP